jgi:hypothetical protein
MKHPSSRGLFDYWDEARGDAAAPERSAFHIAPIRSLLGDSFVIANDADAGHPFRVTGTRVNALFARDMKGERFAALWLPDSRRDIDELLAIASDEMLGAVAGATAPTPGGAIALELLLLPFSRQPHTPATLTGSLAPLTVPAHFGAAGIGPLALTSWRHVGHRPQTMARRALRRWRAARGLMVYEGLRGER